MKGNSITLQPKEQSKPYIYVAYDQYRKFIKIPNFSQDFDITFHPEGGYMIPGKSNKIGFKAIDKFGSGISVSGTIRDSKQNEITKFEDIHKGIGFFTLLPDNGENYTAVCSFPNGTQKSFQLPDTNPNATIIKADKRGDYINFYPESTDSQRICGNRIIVHQRGILIADTTIGKGMKGIAINICGIPDGIVNAVLFDNKGNPLSERLIFSDNRNNAGKMIESDREKYSTRQKVTLRLGSKEKLPMGNFAMSVTDNKSIDSIPDSDIISTLLLSSEIKGSIEEPSYYFNRKNADTDMALEALMLTQGWRRYDIPALFSGKISEPKGLLEAGEEITGTICSKWTNKPESNATINVLVPKFRYAGIFKADSIGCFSLNGFEFPEETTFLISANNENDKNMFPNFKIDTPKYPLIRNIIHDIPKLGGSNDPMWETFVLQEGTRFKYNGLGVTLNEIVVTGLKVKPFEDFFQANAFRTFDWNSMEKDGITEAEEVLRKISGLRISSDGYFTFRMESVGLIIDGVPQNTGTDVNREFSSAFHDFSSGDRVFKSKITSIGSSGTNPLGHTLPSLGLGTEYESPLKQIDAIPFDFIRRIDFIPPGNATVFGEGFGGGAIVITTKRGNEFTTTEFLNHIAYTPLGYQRKAVFYSPRYDTPEAQDSSTVDLRPTVYWNPTIKVDDSGKAEVSFYTNDSHSTSYTVRIEGVSDGGEIVRSTDKIEAGVSD